MHIVMAGLHLEWCGVLRGPNTVCHQCFAKRTVDSELGDPKCTLSGPRSKNIVQIT